MEELETEISQRPVPAERSPVQFDELCPSRPDRATQRKTDGALDISRNRSARLHFRSY